MMVNDAKAVDWQSEFLTQSGRHFNDGIPMLIGHLVSPMVKITQVFYANRISISSKNTSWSSLQRPSGYDCSIWESSKMLPNITPAIVSHMMIFHRYLPIKMVSSIEMHIAGTPGVMLLNSENGSGNSLGLDPSPKLCHCHF